MKLEEIVGKRDIDATKLAKRLGYHRNAIGAFILGKKKPTLKFIKALEAVTYDEIKRTYSDERVKHMRELRNKKRILKTLLNEP